MANVRDSDTSLWLHNKLGTSNDSWISGSICSQLNKEVLRNIKECFPDLQTQVKLKLLLSFFHIPRRLVEEWKAELEEVIEVAGLDSELWVSMLAESMKTFPATSSLNTEISDYEDTRPIFTDMVNDLRKLVAKHSDLGMLPLECQYLNKNALISVVGQQPNTVKHFTIKRKPKSAALRTELLHKSADAQSSLKKTSAPTIPLRSRGMPRKMTDTTPLKGIPSRVPSSGFRSPSINAPNAQRPNMSRTPAGRKDGGIKLIELSEQPLGYAAAKKRKREQQLEEQARKQEQKAAAALAAVHNPSDSSTSPSNANNSNASGGQSGTKEATTPTTPTSANNSFEIKTETNLNQSQSSSADEGGHLSDSKEDIKPDISHTIITKTTEKTNTPTPEYAPPSLSYTQNTPSGILDNVNAANQMEDTKPSPQKLLNSIMQRDSAEKAALQQQLQQSPQHQQQTNNSSKSNSNLNHIHKRIKQEIKIESEEILVPANIKVEKLDPPPLTQHIQQTQTIPTTTTLGQRLQQQTQVHQQQPQQRVIIQQQHQQTTMPTLQQIQQTAPTTTTTTTNQHLHQQQQQQTTTQHVIIRTSPQQQKQTLTVRQQNTPTTPIKMEKLEIKPLVRSTPQPGTIITQQQPMRPVSSASTTAAASHNNPLANLPNNISVKITSTKTGKVTQSSQQQSQQQKPILINSSTPVILASTPSQTAALRQQQLASATASTQNATPQTAQAIKSMPLSQLKNATNSGPVIISQTIIQPAKRAQQLQQQQQQSNQQQSQQTQIMQQQQQQQQTTTTTQYILTQQQPTQQQHQQQTLPTLTTFTPQRQQQTTYQTTATTPQTPTSHTKILLKTSPTSSVVIRQQQQPATATQQIVTGSSGNPPPLIASSSSSSSSTSTQPTLLNIQNVQLPNRPVTIQPASHAAQQQHMQAQLQQQQHTLVSNNTATQQPKLTQVLMQPGGNATTVSAAQSVSGAAANVKNKTIILTQKGVILRNIGGDMYQQIPISNVSGLQNLGSGGAALMTTAAGPPGLVKTTSASPQTITLHQQQQSQQTTQATQKLTTLIPTQQHMIVQQQPQATTSLITNQPSQQTIIRPVMANVQSGLTTTLPGGLTLIQRPGQQPQLVQVQTTPVQAQSQSTAQIQRTIITQPALQQQQTSQLRPQQIVLQQKPATTQQRLITTTTGGIAAAAAAGTQQIQLQQTSTGGIQRTHIIQMPQQQQPQQQAAPQRKGLSLSNEHVHKAHEMFRKANRVSRPDKALILGFMAGMRENPRPNSENVIVIKLGETEEKVQQEDGQTALCLVESHIRLDYNTGEWKTFQNYRRLDQTNQSSGDSGGNVMQTQNSVVI